MRITAKRRSTTLEAAIEDGAVESSIDLTKAPLAEVHVVEAILAAIGAIDAPSRAITCRNCGEIHDIEPARALPIDPLMEPGGDPELDAAPPLSIDEALPAPIAIAKGRRAVRFRLRARTLADRTRLVKLAGRGDEDDPPPLPIAPPLVRALGLSFVDEKGRPIESPIAIARALERLDDDGFDEAWSAIAEAFDRMHYPPRLLAPVACPSCGARHDVEVLPRPILPTAPRAIANAREFPSIDAFRATAAAIAAEVMANEGLDEEAGVEVIVDDDVPPCDDGGEPLLGSYTPRGRGGDLEPSAAPYEVALYYRSFRAMYEEEPYDVAAEIRETLEHELEHHRGHLAGDDPLDDEERAEIAREHARLHGKKGARAEIAAGTSWLAGDFARFLKATWPIWLVVALAAVVVAASSR